MEGVLYPETDFNSWQEGRNGGAGNATYAFITARSYHTGVVNSARVDGSVQTVSDSIDLSVCGAPSQPELAEKQSRPNKQ